MPNSASLIKKADSKNRNSGFSAEGARKNLALAFLTSNWTLLLLLVLLVTLCFGRTLTSYFLADDIGEISYVSRALHDSPRLFFANFTGNYMQIASMSVYRPVLFLSLVCDYLFYGANACGYYATNLLFYAGAVVLFYLVTKQLTESWGQLRSKASAFFAAALFASSPLHAESVSWVVGRVDINCAFFFLLSYLLALKSWNGKGQKLAWLSLGSFWLALLTKEMAVGLPVLLTFAAFFFVPSKTNVVISERLLKALRQTSPYWASLGSYFAIRYFALGTIFGGYTGSIGVSQLSNAVARWTDPDTISRLLFPFNYFLFHTSSVWSQALAFCYCLILICALAKSAFAKGSLKLFAFVGLFCLTSAVPIYQLWGLGSNLEGARFYFFLTMGLSLLLSLIVFSPPGKAQYQSKKNLWFTSAQVAALVLMVAIFYRAAYANNSLWVRAGHTVRQVQVQSQALAKRYPGSNIVLLGLPKDLAGAHMILNGYTFSMLVSKPFINEDLACRFRTFEPFVFGSASYINPSQFEACLRQTNVAGVAGVAGPFVWDDEKSRFDQVAYEASEGSTSKPLQAGLMPNANFQPYILGHALYQNAQDSLELSDVKAGDGIVASNLHISPLDADYLAFDIKCENPSPNASIDVRFANPGLGETRMHDLTQSVELVQANPGFQHVLVPLSANWHWFAESKIENLAVTFFPASKIQIKNLALAKANMVAPQLSLSDQTASPEGLFAVSQPTVNLQINQKDIQGASSAIIEISKVNSFFENLPSSKQSLAVSTRIESEGQATTVRLSSSLFKTPGFYQIRARALDGKRAPLGDYSCPITLHKENVK